MKYRIILVMLMLLIFSCSTNENKHKPSTEVKLNQKKTVKKSNPKNNMDFNSIFIKKNEILLQEDDDHLMMYIQQIIIHNNDIIIADKYSKQLLIFNNKGKFKKSIGRAGRGPGEFQNIESITINNNKLLLLDNKNKKVLKFDLEGNFLKSFDILGGGSSILYDTNNGFYLYNPASGPKPLEVDIIKHYNESGEIINSFCRPFFSFGLTHGSLLYDKNGNLYATETFSSVVVKYSTTGKLLKRYNLRTGNHKLLKIKNDGELPKIEELNGSTMLIGFTITREFIFAQFLNIEETKKYSWIDIYNLNGDRLVTNIVVPPFYILGDVGDTDNIFFYDMPDKEITTGHPNFRILEYKINKAELYDMEK